MKKRLLSLLCVLALCLGLLPVTALAAENAPTTLYVGGQVLDVVENSYWTTNENGKLTTCNATENWNVAYDAGSAALTLNNAKIVNNNDDSSIPYGAGIYAECGSGQSVSLTIVLIGENTIEGNYGILVDAQQGDITGIDASLIIKSESGSGSGSSSLKVTGSGNYGISVKSGTGDASLTIENASVAAKTTSAYSYYAGVYVQSSAYATDSPQLSLAVHGGSLTASGSEGSDGILFYVGSPNATATTLTVSGNAIVDAKTGGISATQDMSQFDPTISTADSNGGIVFDGTKGTVYGEVTLQDELTIGSGETLTIPDGAKLDCNGNLTNSGTILVESGGTVSGNLSGGTALTTPTINTHPQAQEVTAGETATFSVAASNAQTYQWQQSTDSGSSWADISGAASASYTTVATTTGMNHYQYRCVVKSASGVSVISSAATLTVTEPAIAPPSITTESLPNGKVGSAYSKTLAANGDTPITWSLANDSSLPAGLSLGADGTISGTPTTAGTFDFTVTATNSAGSDSKKFSLTIQSATVPVTGVTLSETALSLFTGESANLTATVEPGNATNKNVTWSSDNEAVATVDNSGKVTAVGAGEANITVTTEDGNYTATCQVTVTQSTYSISADTESLNFGSVYVGYAQPAAKTVTITNTGNQSLTLTQPASTSSFEVGTLTDTALAAGEKATFTVQPKAGLAVGTYSEDITVSSSQSATVTISASFTVKQRSSGGSSSSSSVSDQTVDKIEAAKDGSTVEITLRTGQTTLDKEVFEELAGRDVTLEISLSNGVTWSVNGQDIPENAKLSDLDLGVTLDASAIPASVINAITGAVDTIQLSLKHDGAFGFTMTLTAPLGKENKGLWANLYYYNEDSRELEFQAADKIASDGTASFPFDHASDYAIVIDTDSHEPVELPFTDVPEDAWYADAAAYVYKHGLMAGTSATTFAPEVTTSRAMIATILWRMAGSPVVNYAMTYTDVDPAAWYGEAVRWATSEGVVTGYGNGLFGTNDPITREQFATMLWRFAQTEDYDVSVGEDTNILSYTDAFDVAEYAIPAMQWACGAGVITGTGDGSTLTPQGQATRAQAAVMLMQFCENYVTW